MEEALVAMLLADASVQARVVTRVWWAKRPQGSSLPAVVLHRIGGPGVGDHMTGHDGLEHAMLQIDSWAATYAAAKLTARAVRAALYARSDAHFTGFFITAERDDVDEGADGKTDLFRTSLDAQAWFLTS